MAVSARTQLPPNLGTYPGRLRAGLQMECSQSMVLASLRAVKSLTQARP